MPPEPGPDAGAADMSAPGVPGSLSLRSRMHGSSFHRKNARGPAPGSSEKISILDDLELAKERQQRFMGGSLLEKMRLISSRPSTVLVPLAVTVLLMVVGTIGVLNYRSSSIARERALTRQLASNLAVRLVDTLNLAMLPLFTISSFAKYEPNITKLVDDFQQSVGDDILQTGGASDALMNIQLQPKAQVMAVVPLEGNEGAIGHDLLHDSQRSAGVLAALRKETGPTMVGPLEVLQGGYMLIARLPLFSPNKNRALWEEWSSPVPLFTLGDRSRRHLAGAVRDSGGNGGTAWQDEGRWPPQGLPAEDAEQGPVAAEPGGFGGGGRALLDHWDEQWQDPQGETFWWGLATVLVDFGTLLELSGFKDQDAEGFNYALVRPRFGEDGLRDGDIVMQVGGVEVLEDLVDPVNVTMQVPNGIWELLLAPKDGWDETWVAPAGVAVGLVSLFVGGLILVVMWSRENVTLSNDHLRATAVKLEQRGQEVNEARAQQKVFLSYVCHEVRNPLTAVSAGLEMLRMSEEDFPEGEEGSQLVRVIDTIRYSLNSATKILGDDTLSISRIEEGRLVLEPSLVSLSPLASRIVANLSGAAKKAGVTLEFVSASSGDNCMADPHRLEQVVQNLTNNALKFTPRGGKVVVRVVPALYDPKSGREQCSIQVTDTGCGIREGDIQKLFKTFSQINAGRNQQGGGTGLGLSISKAIAELHGGDIEVTSVEGKGSTFTLFLPSAHQLLRRISLDESMLGDMSRPGMRTSDGNDGMAHHPCSVDIVGYIQGIEGSGDPVRPSPELLGVRRSHSFMDPPTGPRSLPSPGVGSSGATPTQPSPASTRGPRHSSGAGPPLPGPSLSPGGSRPGPSDEPLADQGPAAAEGAGPAPPHAGLSPRPPLAPSRAALPPDWRPKASDGSAEGAVPRPARSLRPQPLAGFNILLVDDDTVVRTMTAMLLEKWGARVALGSTGREFLSALGYDPDCSGGAGCGCRGCSGGGAGGGKGVGAAADAFSFVMMDGNMPEMHGDAALVRLRRQESVQGRERRTIVGIFTGDVLEDMVRLYLNAGADLVIAKPLRTKVFEEQLLSLGFDLGEGFG